MMNKMINTNTIWAKIIIAFSAIEALLTGINFSTGPDDHPTFWPVQIPLNLFCFWLIWIGYQQINKLREECRKTKTTVS